MHVNQNLVAVFHECNGATIGSFRSNVPNAEAPCAATETTIGNECAVGTTASAFQSARNSEHFTHTWATLRAFVSNDQHGSRLDITSKNCRHCAIFTIKNSCSTFEVQLVFAEAGNLYYRATWSQRARQYVDATLGVNGVRKRVQYIAIGCRRINFGKVFCHRFSGTCHHVAVQQTCIEQHLQNHRNTTYTVDVGHVVLAAWLGIGNVRNLCCNAVEVFQLEWHFGFMRNGKKMQNSVSAST